MSTHFIPPVHQVFISSIAPLAVAPTFADPLNPTLDELEWLNSSTAQDHLAFKQARLVLRRGESAIALHTLRSAARLPARLEVSFEWEFGDEGDAFRRYSVTCHVEVDGEPDSVEILEETDLLGAEELAMYHSVFGDPDNGGLHPEKARAAAIDLAYFLELTDINVTPYAAAEVVH